MTLHDALRASLERSNLIAARMTPDGRKIVTVPVNTTAGPQWDAYVRDHNGVLFLALAFTEIDAISDLLDLLEERE